MSAITLPIVYLQIGNSTNDGLIDTFSRVIAALEYLELIKKYFNQSWYEYPANASMVLNVVNV